MKQSSLKRKPMKRRTRVPKDLRRDVLEFTHGFCFLCQKRNADHLHHFLPVQRFPELALELDNMAGMCFGCHFAHENASRRITWDELPRRTVEWAQEIGDPWLVFLERTYAPEQLPEDPGSRSVEKDARANPQDKKAGGVL